MLLYAYAAVDHLGIFIHQCCTLWKKPRPINVLFRGKLHKNVSNIISVRLHQTTNTASITLR